VEAFQQTKEIYGASVLNNAQTYNAAVGGDGVSRALVRCARI